MYFRLRLHHGKLNGSIMLLHDNTEYWFKQSIQQNPANSVREFTKNQKWSKDKRDEINAYRKAVKPGKGLHAIVSPITYSVDNEHIPDKKTKVQAAMYFVMNHLDPDKYYGRIFLEHSSINFCIPKRYCHSDTELWIIEGKIEEGNFKPSLFDKIRVGDVNVATRQNAIPSITKG